MTVMQVNAYWDQIVNEVPSSFYKQNCLFKSASYMAIFRETLNCSHFEHVRPILLSNDLRALNTISVDRLEKDITYTYMH